MRASLTIAILAGVMLWASAVAAQMTIAPAPPLDDHPLRYNIGADWGVVRAKYRLGESP